MFFPHVRDRVGSVSPKQTFERSRVRTRNGKMARFLEYRPSTNLVNLRISIQLKREATWALTGAEHTHLIALSINTTNGLVAVLNVPP